MYYVAVDLDKCEACGDCVANCPNDGFIMTETDGREHAEYVGDDCIGCEACVAVCPTEAITLMEL